MTAALTLTRYRTGFIFFGLLSMAVFRLFLHSNQHAGFYRLLGCGKYGRFGLHPDWKQYGIFSVNQADDFSSGLLTNDYAQWKKEYYGRFIHWWWTTFGVETWTIILKPVMAHGKWGGREIFKGANIVDAGTGPLAVLTRAGIRPSKAITFWKNVPDIERQVKQAKGLAFAVGIGEMPLFRQATFSIWITDESLKAFAYEASPHRDVIRKTREDNWYSEELFARFIPLQSAGTLNKINPFSVGQH